MSRRAPAATDPRLAYRDASGAVCSEGRRLLGLLHGSGKTRTPLKILADQIGGDLKEQYVGQLIAGKRLPSIEVAVRIFLKFGIAAHAWGLAPAVKLSASKDSSTTDAALPTIETSDSHSPSTTAA